MDKDKTGTAEEDTPFVFADLDTGAYNLPRVVLPRDGTACAESADPFYVVSDSFGFTVPLGYKTDGASIPRFLWRVCGHPLEAPRVYAALAHDYLYGGGLCSRKEADTVYRRLLILFGVSSVKAWTEYAALRAFGWTHFYKAR